MARLYALLSYFHVALAMVLLTVAALAVPENAFADEPVACAMPVPGEPGYDCYFNDPEGMGTCCAGKCGGDTACTEACCCGACSLNYAVGSTEYNDCVSRCNAASQLAACDAVGKDMSCNDQCHRTAGTIAACRGQEIGQPGTCLKKAGCYGCKCNPFFDPTEAGVMKCFCW